MTSPVRAQAAKQARLRRSRRAIRTACLLAGLILPLTWCGVVYYRIASFDGAALSGNAAQADAGIVLGASLWNDRPSPGLRERLDHALLLYRQGVFPSIIVTGGLDTGGATLTEAEGMRNYLVEQGVPQDSVFLDTQSRSTYQNLLYAKRILRMHGWRTAVIVTHRYHGARAADIARLLDYRPVLVSVTDTKVMNMAYHRTREILAFTKWQLTKVSLAFS